MKDFAFEANTRQGPEATGATPGKETVNEYRDIGSHLLAQFRKFAEYAGCVAHCIHHAVEIISGIEVCKAIEYGSESDQRATVGEVGIGDLDQLIDTGFGAVIADGVQKFLGIEKHQISLCNKVVANAGRTVLWIGPQQGFIDVRDTVAIGIFQRVFHHKNKRIIPYTLTEGISDKHATYQLGVGVSGSFDCVLKACFRGRGETADRTA